MPEASALTMRDCGNLNTSGLHSLTALEADELEFSSLTDSDVTALHL